MDFTIIGSQETLVFETDFYALGHGEPNPNSDLVAGKPSVGKPHVSVAYLQITSVYYFQR